MLTDATSSTTFGKVLQKTSAEIFLTGAVNSPLPNKAVKAVGNIKRSCQTGPEIPFEYHLALERELQAALFNSSDAKEGIAAYVEKRVANFTGQ